MEIELRGILLGVGMIILIIVGLDLFKRKNNDEDNSLIGDDEYIGLSRSNSQPIMPMEEYADADLNLYVNRTLPEQEISDEVIDYDAPCEIELEPEPERVPSKIITITIMARDPYGFKGADLIHALEAADMQFGKNDIFHRYHNEEILFSIVNAVEPGFFILETLAGEYVPGITMILLPEQVEDPELAFDKFIRAAKQIAFALNGEMLDHARRPLTMAMITEYQKEVSLQTA